MTWKKTILNTVERSRTEYDMEKINTAAHKHTYYVHSVSQTNSSLYV